MTIKDIINKISFPVWINEDPFADRYESKEEILNDGMMDGEIEYITTNCDGELVLEVVSAYCLPF